MIASRQDTRGLGRAAVALAWLGPVGAAAILTWLSAQEAGYFAQQFYLAAVFAWALVGIVVVAVWPRLSLPAHAPPALLSFSLMVTWTGLTLFWSIGPNLTLEEFTREALYLAIFLAVLMGPRSRRAVGYAVAGFLLIAGGVAVFALLAKVSPAYSQEYTYSSGRLMGSIGYWNGLAAFMALASALALRFAASPRVPHWGRLAATAELLLLGVTLFYTLSRGGLLVAAGCVLLYLIFAPDRLAGLLALVSGLIPGGLFAWYTYAKLPSLHAAAQGARIVPTEGRQFAYLLLAAVAAAVLLRAAALLLPSRMPRGRLSLAASILFWLLLALLAAGFVYSQRSRISRIQNQTSVAPGQYDKSTLDTRGAERLASISEDRTQFWRVGISTFEDNKLKGTGGGTFRFAEYRLTNGIAFAKDPHSVWVRLLSDQGAVGLALFLGFLASLAWAFAMQMRRNPRLMRDSLYIVLLIFCAGWLADTSFEFNWALPALSILLFIAAALALSLGDARDIPSAGVAAPAPLPEAAGLPGAPRPNRASGLPPGGAARLGPRNEMGYSGGGTAAPVTKEAGTFAAEGAVIYLSDWLKMGIMLIALILSLVLLDLLAARVFSDRAWDSLDAGNLASARQSAQRAHQLNYLEADPLYVLSEVSRRQGDNVTASEYLLSAINLEPQQEWLNNELALLYFYDMKQTSMGITYEEHAIDLDPQNYPLHIQLHRMVSDKEQFDRTGVMPHRPADVNGLKNP